MNRIAFVGDGKLITGKKILGILRSMGATNIDNFSGNHASNYIYYIGSNNLCVCTQVAPLGYKLLTVEQYEEKKVTTEPLDLTKILEGCEGMELWCSILGKILLVSTSKQGDYPIEIRKIGSNEWDSLTKEGKLYTGMELTECIIFPSFENRDWSAFKKPVKPIEFGTPVMTSNNGTHWKLKKYNEILQNTYIVPVDKFDFSNFEANKY